MESIGTCGETRSTDKASRKMSYITGPVTVTTAALVTPPWSRNPWGISLVAFPGSAKPPAGPRRGARVRLAGLRQHTGHGGLLPEMLKNGGGNSGS